MGRPGFCLCDGGRLCGPSLLRRGDYFKSAGGGGLPRGDPRPAGLSVGGGFQALRASPSRLSRYRREYRSHGCHYTVSGKRRSYDYYSPGGKTGRRPDRATIVYCNRIREAYGDVPIILGGLEASLRRFAHYDYWDKKVRRSILVDSGADLLTYGMGENILRRVARLLDRGVPIRKIRDVRGTVYLASPEDKIHYEAVGGWDYEELKSDKRLFAEAFGIQYKNQDSVTGKAITERYGGRLLVQNPPMPPLEREELDRVYALPYTRRYHPSYEKEGGIPGLAEVQFPLPTQEGASAAAISAPSPSIREGRCVREASRRWWRKRKRSQPCPNSRDISMT